MSQPTTDATQVVTTQPLVRDSTLTTDPPLNPSIQPMNDIVNPNVSSTQFNFTEPEDDKKNKARESGWFCMMCSDCLDTCLECEDCCNGCCETDNGNDASCFGDCGDCGDCGDANCCDCDD